MICFSVCCVFQKLTNAVVTLDIPFEGAPTELLTHHSLEIARQLTLREFRLFKTIPPREFIKQAWMKTDDQTKAPELKKVCLVLCCMYVCIYVGMFVGMYVMIEFAC